MFKKLSFSDAHEIMIDCERAVDALKTVFGDAMMEMVHDAVNHYAQTPALWGCEEEADYAALFALALTQAGYNSLLPEYDVTRSLMQSPGVSGAADVG